MSSRSSFEEYRKKSKERASIMYEEDLWNLDCTLAEFMLPKIRAFKALYLDGRVTKLPSSILNDLYPDRRLEGEYTDEEFQKGVDTWVEILGKVERSFLHILSVNGVSGSIEESGAMEAIKEYSDYEEGMGLLGKYLEDMWT